MMNCPRCKSANVYFSRKKKVYVCEDCNFEFNLKEKVSSQKIFFSYGHDSNEPLVKRIKEDLEKRGHVIWFDRTDIHAGEDWRKSITDGLIDSSTVLSFLSSYSVRVPGVCLDELKIALCVKQGYIKTILLESEDKVKVPTTISDIQWLDFSDWKTYFNKEEYIWESWYKEKFDQLCEIVESEEAKTFSGEIQQLKLYLKPNLLDTKEKYLLQQPYVGRKWLSEIVDKWTESKDGSRAFVLIAGPGIGKSCFVANSLHFNPNVICGLFCEWDKPQTVNVKSIIKTIAFKLSCKLKDYRKLLLNFFETYDEVELMEKATDEELFSMLLTTPLNSLIDGNRQKCIIAIDGLDEAATTDGGKLMRILADNLKTLPSWIGFMLTSRPEHGVENIFGEYNPYIIQADNIRNINDIKEYLVIELREELSKIENKLETLNKILNSSEGSFLYASLIVQEVKLGKMDLRKTNHYPVGLSGFYYRNFKRNYKIDEYKNVRKIIELVVASKVFPLDLMELFEIDPYEYSELLIKLGSLMTEVTIHFNYDYEINCLSFSHKSILDWLTNRQDAGEFYVDIKNAAKRLTDKLTSYLSAYGLKKLSTETVNKKNIIYKYIEENLGFYYANGQCWNELECFLTDEKTPFLPYWKVVSSFPAGWDITLFVNRLKNDSDSIVYLKYLQKNAEISLAKRLLEKLSDEYGVSGLSLEQFKVFTDLIHLNGEYEKAVKMNNAYLEKYSIDEIINNHELLAIKTRTMHHSKFFMSAETLRKEVDDLLDHIKVDKDVDACLELLIMGGNLGTLLGDMDYAETCNDKALNISRSHNKPNFMLRAVRKKIDILKYFGKYDEALTILNDYVSIDSEIDSRYRLYLLLSLGDILRNKKDFDGAFACCDRVKIITEDKGIWGWWAHSMLLIGCLMCDFSHFKEAEFYFDSALKKYNQMGHVWGSLTARVCLLILAKKTGKNISIEEIQTIEATIDELHYDMYKPYLESLKNDESIDSIPLMFI